MSANHELVKRILNEWNNTSKKVLNEVCLHELFERRVASQPNAIAISTGNIKLTYDELNQKANLVARFLINKGVVQGEFIGVLMNYSPEQIICLLAILKVGAAYVPMNMKDPFHRIAEIAISAHLKYVITDTDLAKNNPDFKICHLTDLQDVMLGTDSGNLNLKSDIFLPAYIIYTSGSTGKPKGVLVTHQTVSNLIEWVNTTFNVDHNDILLWSTNLCFDLSVYDIFGSLATGSCIRILNAIERLNPELQFQILQNEGITFWDSAPQGMQQLGSFFHKPVEGDRSKLRLVFLSGDWIPLKLSDEIKSVFKNATVVALGGNTEATVWSNYYIIDQVNPVWRSIPYGKPIQNARYYVLNEELNHCDLNEKGDLYIGGNVLAREYFGDVELTNKKFLDDPFFSGHKMFKTGDKALWMPDGNVEFLGREDDQLKVRGFRVEVGEIKSAALQINYVNDAVVIADKSDKFNVKVILFITSFMNEIPNINNVKDHLRKVLPEYMIPSFIFHLPQIPITGNGKVDATKLMEIYNQNITNFNILDNNNLTDTEKKIAKIWIEVLKISNFNINDNFFDIGGNSILSVHIVSKIEEVFGIKFNIRDFFENPKISTLTENIDIKLSTSFIKKESTISTKIVRGEI